MVVCVLSACAARLMSLSVAAGRVLTAQGGVGSFRRRLLQTPRMCFYIKYRLTDVTTCANAWGHATKRLDSI